jgi:hypothetical protein
MYAFASVRVCVFYARMPITLTLHPYESICGVCVCVCVYIYIYIYIHACIVLHCIHVCACFCVHVLVIALCLHIMCHGFSLVFSVSIFKYLVYIHAHICHFTNLILVYDMICTSLP